jgi:hypothetical protein
MSADLDKAIDRAVREMLDVEPREDLRARVVSHIDGRRVRYQFPVASFQRFAMLVGAAAVLVLVLVLARHSGAPPAPPPAVARDSGRPMVIPAPARSPIDVPIAPERMAAATSNPGPHRPDGVAYAASIDTAPGGAAIDPLKIIAPIEMAPIGQSSIAPEPIGVHPLERITEMQIAPLSPPDGRD